MQPVKKKITFWCHQHCDGQIFDYDVIIRLSGRIEKRKKL